MKTENLLLPILALCMVAFVGCKKTDQQGSTREFHGINVDWPKLDAEFAKAGADVQDSVTLLKRFFRYAQFPQALMELDKLSNDPNLTEPQKKLVNNLIEQTKKAIEKSAAALTVNRRDGAVAIRKAVAPGQAGRFCFQDQLEKSSSADTLSSVSPTPQ